MTNPNEPINASMDENNDVVFGLTKREHFAALVLQGFCANPAIFAPNEMTGWSLVNSTPAQLCSYALEIADSQIEALNAK